MATGCETARNLLYKVGQMIDEGVDGSELTRLSAMAKLYCSDVAMRVTTDAVQVLGGYGLHEGVPRRANAPRREKITPALRAKTRSSASSLPITSC